METGPGQMTHHRPAWLTSGPVATILALFNQEGEEARVVGGAVRNLLLGKPQADIDIATTATPDMILARAKAAGIRTEPTGIDHGTVMLILDNQAMRSPRCARISRPMAATLSSALAAILPWTLPAVTSPSTP